MLRDVSWAGQCMLAVRGTGHARTAVRPHQPVPSDRLVDGSSAGAPKRRAA